MCDGMYFQGYEEGKKEERERLLAGLLDDLWTLRDVPGRSLDWCNALNAMQGAIVRAKRRADKAET